jgi:polyisoprenoid-binding protein YceI
VLPSRSDTERAKTFIVVRMNANTIASASAPSAATRWSLDPGHSAVGFSIRHNMITNVRGEFDKFSGELTYDPDRPEATHLQASIDVASLDTREARRDGTLRSALFFDVENHPVMTFVSKSASAVGAGNLDVVGDLTIRGISHEVTLAVREISALKSDIHRTPRLGATATTKIRRSDYGMTWNTALEGGGFVLGDVVTITLELSLKAQ